MITLDIPDTGTRLYMPEDLSQCDERQYNEMSMLIYHLQHGKLPYEVFRVHAVYKLLNMKPVENGDASIQEEKMANVYQLSNLVDDFFEEGENEVKVLKQYYVHNPIPKVRPLLANYYGPSDDFANLQFGEYIDALHLFSEYHATGDDEYLYRLMATLYRPIVLIPKKGQRRKEYFENDVERRAKVFRKLYFGQVYGFYLLFASFQKYLATAKIYWQGRELDLSILFEEGEETVKSDIPGIGMKSTLYTLAESGVFGSINELKRENLWEILMRMYDLTKRDRDYRAKMEFEKNKK